MTEPAAGRRLFLSAASAFVFAGVLTAGAAEAADHTWTPAACTAADAASRDDTALLRCFAPVFVVEEGNRSFNRIGTPALYRTGGRDRARIDTETPAVFTEARRDAIGGTRVLHLVYRVHFEKLAFKPSVFFERHRNVGVLAIVTLREADSAPILLTTVYTCGCYRIILATDLLDDAALPPGWRRGKRSAGHDLPARLTAPRPGESRYVIRLTSKAHRLAGVETSPVSAGAEESSARTPLPLREMKDLHRLPVEGTTAEIGSFFYTRGWKRGHVRGAWSPIEGVTAGLLLLDPMLGMDKEFGDPEETGTRFYTSLLPWRRDASRLDRYEPLLRLLKFRTDRFGPGALTPSGSER
ncbi:MAG: hypothetical protein ABI682_15340 [Acidobacteriota bacterium]